MNTWSYSSLSLFKQCPRKYHRLRVVKDIKEDEAEHLIYGNAVHKAAEEYGRDGVPIPPKFLYIKTYVDTLIDSPGDKYYEHKMGLTRELEPCEFLAGHVWWRGIADFLAVNGKEAVLVDYKTSKSARYADTAQLELLALAIFANFPHVEIVRAGLLFVVSKEFIEIELNRSHQNELWKKWIKDTDRLDGCFEHNTWNPSPNFTCRKFCPVLDCEHNGRG
jgi:hypothetical protein